MKNTIIILCVLFLGAKQLLAQQNSQYTNYMYNHRSINPAYMINEANMIEVGGIHRTQWTGFSGFPKTANIFVSVPLRKNLEVGANFTNDVVGDKIQLTSNKFELDGAYKIRLNETINMAGGLKFATENIQLSSFNSDISDDELLLKSKEKRMFNIGAGVYFFSDNFYVGLSIPNFVKSKLSDSKKGAGFKQAVHSYFTAGYIYQLSYNIKLRPSFIVKEVSGAPLSFDLSLNTLVNDKLELGAAYRNQESFSALISFYAKYNLKFGYSYDFGINHLADFHSGSHEIFTIYRFDTLGLTKTFKSPRFY